MLKNKMQFDRTLTWPQVTNMPIFGSKGQKSELCYDCTVWWMAECYVNTGLTSLLF